MIRNIYKRLRLHAGGLRSLVSLIGIIAIGAVIGLGLAGCGGEDGTTPNPDPGGGDPTLTGTVHISSSPGGSAVTAAFPKTTSLYAVVSYNVDEVGSKDFDYQWSKDGTADTGGYGSGERYYPPEPGSYTVTVTERYGDWSLTSAPVTVAYRENASVSVSVNAEAWGLFISSGDNSGKYSRVSTVTVELILPEDGINDGGWKPNDPAGGNSDRISDSTAVAAFYDAVTVTGIQESLIRQEEIYIEGGYDVMNIVELRWSSPTTYVSAESDPWPHQNSGTITATLDAAKVADLKQYSNVPGSLTAADTTPVSDSDWSK